MTSFAADVRPLFRDKDVQSMKSMFDLSRYQDVKNNADGILATVAKGSMPCDQTWTPTSSRRSERGSPRGSPSRRTPPGDLLRPSGPPPRPKRAQAAVEHPGRRPQLGQPPALPAAAAARRDRRGAASGFGHPGTLPHGTADAQVAQGPGNPFAAGSRGGPFVRQISQATRHAPARW